MESLTPDQNTFLLTPLIVSASNRKTSRKCPENEELKETDLTAEKTEIRFKRYFCSGAQIPDELMKEILVKCDEEEGYLERLSKEVFNNEIVTGHKIRYQFQRNVLKDIISKLEKNGIIVPDSLYDRLGKLMGMRQEEFVERLYLNEAGDEVLAQFSESFHQLSLGTTGLSVWQASCDLANLFRLIPSKQFTRIIELGAGCGVSGISVAKSHNCEVVLTDYDDNVLDLLKTNAIKNGLMSESNENISHGNVKVRCLNWCDFESTDWEDPADLIIAADVVYDTALLPSLCNVLRLLLRNAKAAIVACTRRNLASLGCFEHHLKCANLEVVEMIEYENGEYRINEFGRFKHPTIFPIRSSLKTPTIFYNIQPK